MVDHYQDAYEKLLSIIDEITQLLNEYGFKTKSPEQLPAAIRGLIQAYDIKAEKSTKRGWYPSPPDSGKAGA